MNRMYKILYCKKGTKEIIIDRSEVRCAGIFSCLRDNGYTVYYKGSDDKLHKLFWEKNPQRYLW